MDWTTPKTTWLSGDSFCLAPDYERIRGNLLYLQERAAQLLQKPDYTQMKDYTIQDVPLADFFNAVEHNLQAVAQAVQQRESYQTKTFAANDLVWDWRDLERIEQMQLQIYMDLKAIEEGQQRLAFCLGGGIFGTFV